MDTDNQLLESYARNGSEQAFRELVKRHISLVHSAALRESGGDASLAEDISQAVFTELARRASKLFRHPALAGWLYTCVRRMTANVRRADHRRQRREQQALIMNDFLSPDPADKLWQQVRPELDDVMHELNEQDRMAVVMRFFEGRSLKEVGLALGLTENAARMRVERSLEKLRSLLSQRGTKSTASTLAAVLAAGAVMTAPATLASTVATGALAAASSGATGTLGLAKLLSLAKTKTPTTSGALLILVAAFLLWHHIRSNRSGTETAAKVQVAVPAAARADDSSMLENAGRLTNATVSSQMSLRIVEGETGDPLPGTKLYLFYLRQDGRGTAVRKITDGNGTFGVEGLKTPFHGLNMFVTADGHVPKVTTWGFGRAMPAEYTMKLDRGVTIGGVVVDEAGQPVPGAEIKFDDDRGNNQSLQENIQFGPDAATLADSDGRWSCNMIPKDLDKVSLVITHQEHAETATTVRPNTPDAMNVIITMKAGVTVAGAVRDSHGNSIAGAKVREVRMDSEGKQIFETTDAAGSFEFKNVNPGQLMLAVQAKGFAPEVQTLQITGAVAGVRFQLDPGLFLRGRVTDEDGNPITNAWVETTRRSFRKVEWTATTDVDGRFEWDSAPQEPLLYSFQADGFNRAYALKLPADASEHQIKLTREQATKDLVQITGTAVDADTGQPLDSFKVLMGELEPNWAFPLRFAAAGTDGKFHWSFSAESSHSAYQLQIEKDGYLPAISATLQRKNGTQMLEFKLQKGSGPSGIVILPDGEPAANATVLVCTPQAGVTLDGPAHVATGLNTTTYRAQTDEAGRFSLPAAIAPQGLIVIHEQGYAEAPLSQPDADKALTIVLQPWGRVEGRLLVGSQPAENENIRLFDQVCRYDFVGRRFAFKTIGLDAKTDSAGKFLFEKVPPGECSVFCGKTSAREPRSFFGSHETSVVVKSGEVSQVTLGGTGKPIIGKALTPSGTDAPDWQGVVVRLSLKPANEPGPRPKREDFSDTESFIQAADRFFEAYHAERNFVAFCDSNGSFRLEDIPAGTYELAIRLRDSGTHSVSTDGLPGQAREIASLVREITVPEIPGGQSNEPLDLGALELVPKQESGSAQ